MSLSKFKVQVLLGFLLFSLWSVAVCESNSQKETLNIADMTAPPPTLDPFKVYGTQSQSLFRQMYGNLVDRDESGRLIPAIAEKWVYRGGNVWRLRIRQGVYFQDGSRLTGEDVKFSLERLIGPSSVRARRRDFSFIIRVETIDDFTIEIFTRNPAPTLPARLAQFSMVLPKREVQERGEQRFFQSPIGAGPFRLMKMNQNRAVLQRNEKYYRGKPPAKVAVFHFVKNPRDRVNRLFKNELDLVTNVHAAFTKKIARYPAARIIKKRSLQFNYVNFDTLSDGPLKNRRVRQALAHWTNTSSLIRYVAHGNGNPIPTPVMPEDFGFNPQLKPYPFSPKKGKELMKAAGYERGFDLSAIASDEAGALAKAVKRQWKRLGINLKIKIAPRAEALRLWARTRNYNVFFFSPTNLLQDASYHLRILLDKRHPINRFHHPAAFELIQKVGKSESPDERRRLLNRIQSIVHRELPAIALYQQVKIYAVSNRLKNFGGYPDTILRLYNIELLPSLTHRIDSPDK